MHFHKFELYTSSCLQEIAVKSRQFHSYLNFAILPGSWLQINFWKIGLNLLEKQVIYNTDPLLCFDNNNAKTTYWELQTCGKL